MENQESKTIVLEVDEVTIEFPDQAPDSPTAIAETNPVSDAVSQTDVAVVETAPATTEAEVTQSLSFSTSLTIQNAVNVQKQLTTTHQANTNRELRQFLLPKLRARHNKSYEESLRSLTDLMAGFEALQTIQPPGSSTPEPCPRGR